ncbi:GNAT family N-acetyltransferase [uncultured Roseovarius sp.]|uniref:GNAT family N-acetyltransferase n=1 Tax=uncultured Roseovarius sp. TaxID=293344 RepID=UPI0026151905|nr:GNAT family N-acetyltransferase [uncultured Roseovarius sp.]
MVKAPADWDAFHRIRRAELFTSKGKMSPYDENHADDRVPENTPYLLEVDGQAVGVARLDRRENIGIIRLVAISATRQGQGLGRILGDLLDREAMVAGIEVLRVNAGRDVVGFYERLGWKAAPWDKSELRGIAANAVQMQKPL